MMTVSRALPAALLCAFAVASLSGRPAASADPPRTETPAKVSYYKDVRPILAQNCNGCHQPAKPMGGYITTGPADLLKAGEREKPGVVAGKPDQSYLVEQIRTHGDGKAEMPKGRDPLNPIQVKTITDWVAQGAVDDTPPSAKAAVVDAAHPPTYSAPPVVTGVAFSPDGNYLAVTGYHEILLYSAKNLTLVSRLIGMSERVNALAFSPDGKKLAAVGGAPGRFGEVQVWDHAKERLLISVPVTFDTLYGVSWSPDGTALAFGCADNTVRAIDPLTGKQVLFMATHGDWVLGTVFSQDGQHVASVSRDRSLKLTEVPTQRFVDNLTTISPGTFKGGLMCVDRRPVDNSPVKVRVLGLAMSVERPKRMSKVPDDAKGTAPKVYDELIAAGSDGTPRLYKMHREKPRVMNDDDSNLIKSFEPMPGRISTVKFDATGKHFAAASSLDGAGEVRVYETDTGKKVVCQGVTGAAYTVAWQADGRRIASAGFDGKVWLHDPSTGQKLGEFVALPVTKAKSGAE